MIEIIRKHGTLLFLTAAVIFYIAYLINHAQYEKNYSKIGIFLVAISLVLLVIVLIEKFKDEVHKVFLILYLSIGIPYFLMVLPFNVPDEPNHFARAYEISEGYLLSDKQNGVGGRNLPENLYLDLDQPKIEDMIGKEKVNLSDNRKYFEFWNTSLYAPVSYLPQAIGIAIARCFTKRILILIYAGRLANYLCVLLISYFTIKIAPIGKYIFLLIALIPMNLFEAVSLAPDAVVTALSGALLSFVLFFRYGTKEKAKGWHLILMYGMAIVLGLYKIVYVPFCLFLFLIPKERFKSKRAFFFHACILGTLVAFTSLGWLALSGTYLHPIRNANSDAQAGFLLTHPLQFGKILCDTIKKNFSFYRDSLWGGYLGYLNVLVDRKVGKLYGVVIFWVLLFERSKKLEKFTPIRLLCAGLVVFVCLLIFMSLYVQWNDYLSPEILGVQGRYFLPCMAMICLAIQPVIERKKDKFMRPLEIGVLLTGIHLIVLHTLFVTYF